MRITEMGSRPNLMEVIPEQRLHLQVCRVKCFLFCNQYPEEGSTEAWGMGFPGEGWIWASRQERPVTEG